MTGIPVAIAKITGRYNPDAVLIVRGISMPKIENAAVRTECKCEDYPQEKNIPVGALVLFLILSDNFEKAGKLNLIIPSINIPMISIKGPIIFWPYC